MNNILKLYLYFIFQVLLPYQVPIFVICTTHHIDYFDDGLKQGRLDQEISIRMPDLSQRKG